MRIVQVGTDRLPIPPRFGGAYETYIYGISRMLVKMGHDVHVISFGTGGKEFEEEGIIFHTFSLRSHFARLSSRVLGAIDEPNRNVPFVNAKIIKILRQISKKYGPIDIIHAHLLSTSLAPIVFRRSCSPETKLIFHWHNEPARRRMKRPINMWIAREYDVHCPVSNYVKRKFIEYSRINPSRVITIHNAVDTEIFRYSEDFRNEVRCKLGLEDDVHTILYIGRIIPEKGLHHLVLALSYLVRSKRKFRLLIVGPKGHYEKEEQSYYQYTERLIGMLKLREHVSYLGRVKKKDLPKLYSASDIVVVPSLFQDPCPTVVLEAMACGRPVIAYNVGGIPEIIQNGVTGYIVPKGDIEALCKMIMKCLEEPSHERIGPNARERVEKYFSYSAVCRKLVQLYQRLLS